MNRVDARDATVCVCVCVQVQLWGEGRAVFLAEQEVPLLAGTPTDVSRRCATEKTAEALISGRGRCSACVRA